MVGNKGRAIPAVLAAIALIAAAPQPEYSAAVAMIRNARFAEARTALLRLDVGCKSMVLYLRGVTASKLGNEEETIDTITRAMTCNPPLEARYREEGKKLLRWAIGKLKSGGYLFNATLSTPDNASTSFATPARSPAYRRRQRLVETAERYLPEFQVDAIARQAERNPPLKPHQVRAYLKLIGADFRQQGKPAPEVELPPDEG